MRGGGFARGARLGPYVPPPTLACRPAEGREGPRASREGRRANWRVLGGWCNPRGRWRCWASARLSLFRSLRDETLVLCREFWASVASRRRRSPRRRNLGVDSVDEARDLAVVGSDSGPTGSVYMGRGLARAGRAGW